LTVLNKLLYAAVAAQFLEADCLVIPMLISPYINNRCCH